MAIAWLALHLFSLTRYPLPTCDEGWYASTAYQFVQYGNFGMPIVNNLYSLGDSQVGFGRFYLVALAGSFALFGTGLFQGRLVSLLGVLAVTLATYYTGKRLYDRRAGFIAALLVAFSWDVLARGHLVRPEIWLAASGVGVLGLFRHIGRQPTFKRGLLFGFVATLPMNIHPNGSLFLLGFGVLCLIEFSLQRRKLSTLLGAGIGTTAGGLFWLALHFLPDITESYAQWSSIGQSPVGVDLGWLLESQAKWFVENYWLAYGRGAMLQAAYFIAAMGLALWHRGRANVWLLLLVAISMLAFTFLKVGKQPPTTVLWIPLLALLLAGNLDPIVRVLMRHLPLSRLSTSAVHGLVILPLLVAYVAGDAWLAYRFRNVNYQQQIARLQDLIPSQAYVSGEGTWWIGLGTEHRYLDDSYFHFLRDTREGGLSAHDIAAEFDTLGLDYVIVDEGLGCMTWSSPTHEALKAHLTSNCQAIGSLETPYYTGFKENIIYSCLKQPSSP